MQSIERRALSRGRSHGNAVHSFSAQAKSTYQNSIEQGDAPPADVSPLKHHRCHTDAVDRMSRPSRRRPQTRCIGPRRQYPSEPAPVKRQRNPSACTPARGRGAALGARPDAVDRVSSRPEDGHETRCIRFTPRPNHIPETSPFVVARPRTQPLPPTSPRGKSGAASVCTRRRCSQPQLLSGSSRGWCEAPCAVVTAASASASPSGLRPRWHGFETPEGRSQIQTNCDDGSLALEIGTRLSRSGETTQIARDSSHSSTDTDRKALVRLVERKEGVGPALSYAPPPGDATGQTDPCRGYSQQ